MGLTGISDRINELSGQLLPGVYFLWPWALLLLPLPVLWMFVASIRRSRTPQLQTQGIDIPPSLDAALNDADSSRYARAGRRWWLDVLAWLALVTAVAQPARPGDAVITPVSGRAVVLAVDLSGSMERKDFSLGGTTQDRLSVVKTVARGFINKRDGDRVGLVVFGKEAFAASPLTFDLASLANALDSVGIGMTGRSTAIGDALGLSLSMLREDPAMQKAVVLLSDGTNNAGTVEPEAAATLAQTFGVRVHTIALGSDQQAADGYATAPSADLDEKTLQAIAEDSQGQYFRARTTDDLVAVYTAIDALESSAVDAPPTRPHDDLRVWPLLLLLAVLLLTAWRERRG